MAGPAELVRLSAGGDESAFTELRGRRDRAEGISPDHDQGDADTRQRVQRGTRTGPVDPNEIAITNLREPWVVLA